MANTDRPSGFTPYRHRSGGLIRSNPYKLASAYGSALFRGDACILASGVINKAADNSGTLLGVIEGFRYTAADGSAVLTDRWTASLATLNSGAVEVLVYDDPAISYRCQSDTDTAFVAATHTGGKYDIELDHAGSTVTGQSGMEIDLSDTGTGQFLVIGLIDEPGNAVGVNAKLEVQIAVPLLA